MDDALLVRGVECRHDLSGDAQHRRQRETLVRRQASQPILERLPLDELHHEREQATVALEAVNRGDVRMTIGIGDERGRQCLQRHVAAEALIVRSIYFAHTADAEQSTYLVLTDSITGLQRHRAAS
jgi:hypothetical protein